MGGPSYQKPTPYTKSDGTQAIWDRGNTFVPYDPSAAAAKAQANAATPVGAPVPTNEREGPASAPSPDAGPVPNTGNTRLTPAARRKPGGPNLWRGRPS
jgi:hypothetical protein